jgi:E3 ubiquitin-protein ligase TRIP12
VHKKATSSLVKQTEDLVTLCSGGQGVPSWISFLTTHCQFLFPLQVRVPLFRSVFPVATNRCFRMRSIGISRVVSSLPGIGDRQALASTKFRINRDYLLESAKAVLLNPSCIASFLNIEFTGEPGIGSGPTREFFSLFSEEIQRVDLQMWLASESKPSGNFCVL